MLVESQLGILQLVYSLSLYTSTSDLLYPCLADCAFERWHFQQKFEQLHKVVHWVVAKIFVTHDVSWDRLARDSGQEVVEGSDIRRL
jgi:hypothetical protein